MTILGVYDLSCGLLAKYRNHRRLRVFYLRGVRCVACGLEGTVLVRSRDNGGGEHIDLYHWTRDTRMLMTVDHKLPKSKGGRSNIENLEPMCSRCNNRKGNKLRGEGAMDIVIDERPLFVIYEKEGTWYLKVFGEK